MLFFLFYIRVSPEIQVAHAEQAPTEAPLGVAVMSSVTASDEATEDALVSVEQEPMCGLEGLAAAVAMSTAMDICPPYVHMVGWLEIDTAMDEAEEEPCTWMEDISPTALGRIPEDVCTYALCLIPSWPRLMSLN